MPNAFIETYGCSESQGEAETMAGLLEKAGFKVIENEKNADLIIVVTCYVKSPTEQKILFRIKQLQDSYPEKKLIIAGCMPEGIHSKIVDIVPKASLISTHHIKEIVEAARKTLEGRRVEYLGKSEEIKLNLPKIRNNSLINIVPISSGCNSACSYCCVRLAKGKLFSYPKDMILKEIESSIKQGCKEIWITSQDNASYGLDKGNLALPELLNEISNIPSNFFVRVGMMNPQNVLLILKELLKSYKNDKIYKFLHLPIQSGDDDILERMNRRYKVEDFLKIIKEFKSLNVQLWTDVIVGFPGETEEQFENTIKIIKEVKPDWTNVSKFGLRPGTTAKNLKQLPSRTVSERSERLSKIVTEISSKKNKEWVGWEGDVLITKRGKKTNQWLGRNFAYKLVLVESRENLLGKVVKVRIKETSFSHLKGLLA